MLKNVNEFQNVDSCFLPSRFPLTQVGMHYKANSVAYIIRIGVLKITFKKYVDVGHNTTFLVLSVHPRAPVKGEFRSHMNVPFRIGSPEGDEGLEKLFVDQALQRGMIQLKGHRWGSDQGS